MSVDNSFVWKAGFGCLNLEVRFLDPCKVLQHKWWKLQLISQMYSLGFASCFYETPWLACLLAGGCESAYGGNSLKAAKTALTVLCVFLTSSNHLMKLKNSKGTGVERAGGGLWTAWEDLWKNNSSRVLFYLPCWKINVNRQLVAA